RSSDRMVLKEAGFTNEWLAKTWGCSLADITEKLQAAHLHLTYKKINGMTEGNEVAGYFYSVWQTKEPQKPTKRTKEKVLIIGSGPIRIGQGVEFDYCSVQGIQALKKQGYETVLINNNPATVSTDYTLADALYFEPITVEDVLHVMEFEQIEKVIVQFGGQTAISTEELRQKAKQIEYPVLIRPSYVIGGKGMKVIQDEKQLERMITRDMTEAAFPILIDAYYPGTEIEIDVVTDGEKILIPA